MSTPQPGGDREPLVITRPAAGGKPGDRKPAGTGGSAAAGTSEGDGGSTATGRSSTGKSSESKPSAGGAKGSGAKNGTAARAGSGGSRAGSGKTGAGRPGAGKGAGTTGRATGTAGKGGRPGGRPAGKGGGRRPITPVKVNQGRNWGPIALWTAVGIIVLAIIGYGGWQVYQNGLSWEDRANQINGIKNFRKIEPAIMKPAQHAFGPQKYPQSPPVGGTHNPNWQDCMGDVYDAPIANEHAVHSMEHGAIWVTYRPDLPKDQVDQLAKKVRGNPYMLMSPYTGLDKPISLQTWGYQLKVDKAGDGRIDAFIKALRQNASVEPGAVCSGGINVTGTTPHDLQPQQQGGSGTGG